MPDAHALVTASGAHRWMECTPSARLEAKLPDTTSEAAAEGTVAHSLAEQKLRDWIRTGKRSEFPCEDETMQECTDGYRDYIIELFNELKKEQKNPTLKIEVKLDLSSWVPEGFGTSDAVILADSVLHIIDFKYGKNVKVDAPENPQMRLYALGALDLYGDIFDFDTVVTHIYQPRIGGGHISEETISAEDLLAWGETVKPLARAAFAGTGEPRCGEWCIFCRAKAICRARAEEMFAVLEEQPEAPTLTLEEVAAYLPKLDEAIKWAQGLQDWAFAKALDGENIPGYKLVEGRSNRKITDPGGLAAKLTADGYEHDKIYKPVELLSLTNLEKAVGKKKFAKDYKDYVDKPRGKPVLVPISDEREPYSLSADEMFEEEN